MDDDKVKIGTPGTFLPPFDKAMSTIKRIEEIGYDSVWWPDHLMSWIPESIWTPDIVELANYQENPHVFYETLCTMAVAAWNTKRISLGTSVTETFRRHPAMLAQAFLTLDHLSKGRVILGIGAGEGENVIPYGIEWKKPVSRLEESIKIVKLLWKSHEKVDFEGEFWKLKDAVLALNPYNKDNPPPIWIGAHRSRMLRMTGRLGDGWLPTNMGLKEYEENLRIVQKAARAAGRDPHDVTPALWSYTILDEDHEECHRMLQTPLAKNFLLILPNEAFLRYGFSHPFGENFYGIINYIPTRYSREEVLDALDKVPTTMCEDYFLHGTPDEIISKIEKYAKIGLQHIVLWNITFFCDVSKIRSSFNCMKKVLEYFKN